MKSLQTYCDYFKDFINSEIEEDTSDENYAHNESESMSIESLDEETMSIEI